MEQQHSFIKMVGWLTILSAPFAFTNFMLTGMAAGMAGGSNSQDFSDLYFFITAGPEAGRLMKWSWLADLLGYYLLLVPAVFLLHHWLKVKNPYWMSVFTFCGLAYIFSGSAGAAILAKVWPTLISGYAGAAEPVKEMYRIIFINSTEMVYGGIWGYLEFLLAGIWWIGIGIAMKPERRSLGIVTVILGLFTLIAFAGEVAGLKIIALTGLMVYLFLAPVWAFCLGVSLVRRSDIALETP